MTAALRTVSPDEVMLVEDSVVAEPYDRDFDGMLGFGTGAELLLVLPVLLEALKELASTATLDVAKKWGSDFADWITKGGSSNASAFHNFASVLRGRLSRLLDGGATDQGMPYFVMELIEGRRTLSWRRNARV